MATKLTRCLCGKIFDPAESSVCPACGAEPRNEAPPAQPPAPEPAPAISELRVPQLESAIFPKPLVRATKRGIQVNLTADHLVRVAGGLLAITGIVAGIWWFLHRPDDKTAGMSAKIEDTGGKTDGNAGKKEGKGDGKASPSPSPEPKPTPAPTPAPDPAAPKTWIVDAERAPGSDDAEIEPVLARAKDGDTISLKPGIYVAGFTLDKKIRITGEGAQPGKFVITTKGQKRPTRVTADGAAFANLQYVQDESTNGPGLLVEKDSGLTIEGCVLKFTHNAGILGRSPATFTATNCTFTSDSARAMMLRGPSKVSMTQCNFTGGSGAITSDTAAQFTLRACKFTDVGDKGVKEAAVIVMGADSGITAEDCTFTGCRLPVQADANATLALTKCTFTGNGVPGEKGDFTQGIIAVSNKANARLKEVTFEGNAQGINLYKEGTAEIEDCKFTNGGLLLQDLGFMRFCVPLRIYGEGAKATVRHSTFAQSKPHAISVEDGASVSVDDSDFSGTQFVAMFASKTPELRPGAASEVIVKKSRFTGNSACMFLTAAKGTLDGCEFRNNVSGLSATGAGTTANVTGGTIAGQKDFGLLITSDAALTVTGVSIEENQHGIRIGGAGKPAEKGGALIEECKFKGNTDADVLACQSSKVTMRQCEFDPEAGAKVKREKGAVIESEPPIEGIADIGKKGTSGGASTASNNRSTPSKGRAAPPTRNRPGASDTVRDIINTVDKVRRMFR